MDNTILVWIRKEDVPIEFASFVADIDFDKLLFVPSDLVYASHNLTKYLNACNEEYWWTNWSPTFKCYLSGKLYIEYAK